jgi:hypothetical protein
MGNVTVAEELAGSDELEELCRLDSSESEPEDEPDDEPDDDDQDEGNEGEEGIKPEEMPHGLPERRVRRVRLARRIQYLARSNTGANPSRG